LVDSHLEQFVYKLIDLEAIFWRKVHSIANQTKPFGFLFWIDVILANGATAW
jgi:hypothetical protein